MRYFHFIFLLFVMFEAKAQLPATNNIRIVDAETKKAIPYASVSLLRGNLAINTEPDGLLSIPGDLGKMNDIIFISAQNYTTVRTLLSKLNGLDTILLKKVHHTIRPSSAKVSGIDSVLHKFTWQDVVYFAGVHSERARFEYLQIAQEFDCPVQGALLTKIFLSRFTTWDSEIAKLFLSSFDTWDTSTERTRFRLRFYDVDPATGAPANDICNEIVEVTNKDDPKITVDLQKYNIVITGKKFFVAIEWLRSFENAGYASDRSERNLVYKPQIGILPYKTERLHIWGLSYGHQWKPFNYFSPYCTDLAISAMLK